MLEVLRIGHRDGQRVADFEQRERIELLGDAAWQKPHGYRVDHAVAEPRGGNAQVALDVREDVVLLYHAHFNEGFAEAQALLRALRERLIELLGRDEGRTDKLLAERRPGRSRGRRRRRILRAARRRAGRGPEPPGDPTRTSSSSLTTVVTGQNSVPHRPSLETFQISLRCR